jgi:DNA-directed RNA polymerase specialized sigma subunit
MIIDDSEHFNQFRIAVEKAIAKYNTSDQDTVELQRKQVDHLSDLENKFRQALIKDPNGNAAYLNFIEYILDDKKNILVARPYFRVRRKTFAAEISQAIRDRDVKRLQKFHINYHFIMFVKKGLMFGTEVNHWIGEIVKARHELIEMNLPLVINRAHIFWSRTPKSHLSFMDLIQIGTNGLISGIDKYVGEYSKGWIGVGIGRVVGDLISHYSSTLLHFYPGDKRKIYKANKFKSRHIHGDYEIEDLVKEVSKAEGIETTEDEIISLMAATSIVSADTSTPDNSEETNVANNISRYEAPEESRPDVQVEMVEAQKMMQTAISKLSLFDRKLLRLKGLDISLDKS